MHMIQDNKAFDTAVTGYLNKLYAFKVVTEDEHCKFAADGCKCDECKECKANQ